MSITTDIYDILLQDIQGISGVKKSRLSRCMSMKNDTSIIYSIEVSTNMREMYIEVGKDIKEYDFPKWKGISIEYAKIPEYGEETWYLLLKQLPSYESYIFEIIAEDLRNTIEQAEEKKDIIILLILVLKRWKKFFLMERELVLSPERQQGLFGELMMLKELIEKYGAYAVNYWSGANDETHDFYIFSHAIEVKTTISKSPYRAYISSEYQLDNTDVYGMLFLRFYVLRKSESEGGKISDLIDEIESMLKNNEKQLEKFNSCLEKYGYFKAGRDLYSTGFFIRETMDFHVVEGFPVLSKHKLMPGIAEVKYSINIELCQKYFITKDQLFMKIEGE